MPQAPLSPKSSPQSSCPGRHSPVSPKSSFAPGARRYSLVSLVSPKNPFCPRRHSCPRACPNSPLAQARFSPKSLFSPVDSLAQKPLCPRRHSCSKTRPNPLPQPRRHRPDPRAAPLPLEICLRLHVRPSPFAAFAFPFASALPLSLGTAAARNTTRCQCLAKRRGCPRWREPCLRSRRISVEVLVCRLRYRIE